MIFKINVHIYLRNKSKFKYGLFFYKKEIKMIKT